MERVDLVFGKRAKDLTPEEKKARHLLEKLRNASSTQETRLVYSRITSCADKLDASFKLLREVELILSSKQQDTADDDI